MAPVERVEAQGKIGVRITAGPRIYEVTFNTSGPAAGHIRITEGDKVILDRDLADSVLDNYKRWKDDPRYHDWMTNPHMRTVIGEKEQDEYQEAPRLQEHSSYQIILSARQMHRSVIFQHRSPFLLRLLL